MDPRSIGVTTSGLLGACAAVLGTLSELKGNYAGSEATFAAISAECNTVSSTLTQVREFAKDESRLFCRRLTVEDATVENAFRDAFDCCDVVLVAINNTLDKYNEQTSQVTPSDEKELGSRLQSLHSLNTALGVLVSAIQAETTEAAGEILLQNHAVLAFVKSEAARLKRTHTASIINDVTTTFAFDNEIINTDAYRRAFDAFRKNQDDTESAFDLVSEMDTLEFRPKPPVDTIERVNEPQVEQAIPKSTTDTTKTPPATSERRTKMDLQRSAVYQSARNGHVELLDLLLKRGTDATWERDHWSPVTSAAFNGHWNALEMLFDQGGVNVDVLDTNGRSALYAAASSGYDEIVRKLIERGANAVASRLDGFTPINIAAKNAHVKTVELLLQQPGIDINTCYEKAGSPLYNAAEQGHEELTRILLEHGAEPSTVAFAGYTPSDAAAINGHTKVVELLLDFM